jgi:hypothetical protein
MNGTSDLQAPWRRLSKRHILLFVIGLCAITIAVAACGGGGDSGEAGETVVDWPATLELGGTDVSPVVLNRQLAVTDNRFLVGLVDEENNLILGADVEMSFYKLEGEKGILKETTPADYISFRESFVDIHADGTRHTHEGDEVGAYVAHVHFDSAGPWGVEVSGTDDGGEFGPLRFRFDVFEDTPMPDIGEPAPRTEQRTLRDVSDISLIDSSNPPHPELHDKTVAEALDTGKPVVIAFATPAFCTSRICGPIMDQVIVPLWQKYRDEVEFVHIEPYQLDEANAGQGLVPIKELAEWGLETEPWVFITDREGRIAGKFEGIASIAELEAVLQQVLAAPPGAGG